MRFLLRHDHQGAPGQTEAGGLSVWARTSHWDAWKTSCVKTWDIEAERPCTVLGSGTGSAPGDLNQRASTAWHMHTAFHTMPKADITNQSCSVRLAGGGGA